MTTCFGQCVTILRSTRAIILHVLIVHQYFLKTVTGYNNQKWTTTKRLLDTGITCEYFKHCILGLMCRKTC